MLGRTAEIVADFEGRGKRGRLADEPQRRYKLRICPDYVQCTRWL
jgi:hypothetical protein